jgi:hypothetical protein
VVVDVKYDENLSQRWFNRPGKTAAEQMTELLAEYRRDDMPFAQAWTLALARVRFHSQRDQKSWLEVWSDPYVAAAWSAAYNRLFNFASTSVARLAGMHDALAYSEAQAVDYAEHQPPAA